MANLAVSEDAPPFFQIPNGLINRNPPPRATGIRTNVLANRHSGDSPSFLTTNRHAQPTWRAEHTPTKPQHKRFVTYSDYENCRYDLSSISPSRIGDTIAQNTPREKTTFGQDVKHAAQQGYFKRQCGEFTARARMPKPVRYDRSANIRHTNKLANKSVDSIKATTGQEIVFSPSK